MQSHPFINYQWGRVSNQEAPPDPLGADDILDILNEEPETEKEEEIPLKVNDDSDEEEDEEEDKKTEKEDEEEEKPIGDEETEKELELVVPVSKKQILKKYPKLFEDFPHLEQAYYSEQQYTEMFGTLDDAKEILEKSKILDNVEEELSGGNAEGVLKTVKEHNPEGFKKLVDNYMDNLRAVDESAFYHVISGMFKAGIKSLLDDARVPGQNEERKNLLEQAALIWNQFFFQKSEFEPHKRLSPESEKKDDSLKKEKEDWNRQRLETASSELAARVDNAIKSTIEKNIDPKGLMSAYVKKNAINDVLTKVNHLIKMDKRFQILKDKAWMDVRKNNLSNESIEAIRRMYLGRAKALLESVIPSVRREVLSKENSNSITRHNPIRRTPASSTERTTSRQPKEVPKGIKTLDFLNQD